MNIKDILLIVAGVIIAILFGILFFGLSFKEKIVIMTATAVCVILLFIIEIIDSTWGNKK